VCGEVGYQCISKPNLVAGSPDGCSSQSLPSMAPVVKGQMPVWEQGHPSVAPSRLLDGNENCPSPGCAGAVQYRMHTPGHASRHDIKLASGVSRPLIHELRSDTTFPVYHSEDLRRTASVWFTGGTKASSKCSHNPGSSHVGPRATSHAWCSLQGGDDRFWRPRQSILPLNSSSKAYPGHPSHLVTLPAADANDGHIIAVA
jgi:hypothetical protein